MSLFSFWGTAIRISGREMRAAPGRFVLAALAVAGGVGAFVATRAVTDAFQTALQAQTKPLMAADLSVRLFELPSAAQRAEMELLRSLGASWTIVSEQIAAGIVNGETPRMIVVKTVDPKVYPFYGELRLQPPIPLDQALDSDSVVISRDLSSRWNVAVNSRFVIGGVKFRVAAIIASEPDRWAAMPYPFERVMVTRQGLERTGLNRLATGVHRLLFRLRAPNAVDEVHRLLEENFPEARVLDFRSPNPAIASAMGQVFGVLNLATVAALLLGALSVAMVVTSHLEQRMDTVAILKILGSRFSQIVKIILVQTVVPTLAGSAVGLTLGFAVARWMPLALRDYTPVPLRVDFSAAVFLQGLALGLVSALLFSILPLIAVRSIRPAVVLRRHMTEKPERQILRLGPGIAVTIVLGAGAWAVASAAAGSALSGFWFVVIAAISGTTIWLLASLLLASLRALSRRLPVAMPAAIRHGLANLHRPGGYALMILSALALGVTLILSLDLVSRAVMRDLIEDTAPAAENLFLVNVSQDLQTRLESFLAGTPGVLSPLKLMPRYSMRLISVKGVAIKDSGEAMNGRFRQSWTATAYNTAPAGLRLVEGTWGSQDAAEVVISTRAARQLQVGLGDTMGFLCQGREIHSKITGIGKVESAIAFRPDVVFSTHALQGLDTILHGGVRCEPSRIAAIERAISGRFPSVSVTDISDIVESTQGLVARTSAVIRLVALFVIWSGAMILAAGVIATSSRRKRETAVFRILGATRRRAGAVVLVEFLALGMTAGVTGSFLAAVLSTIVMRRLFGLPGPWTDWHAILFAILATTVLTAVVGWAAIHRHFRGSVLQALRED